MEFKGTKCEWNYKIDNCRIRFDNPNMDLWFKDEGNFFKNEPSEVLHNAKLISAAPELLKALQELSSAVEFLESVDTRTSRANIEARKAIDKALND